MKQLEIDKNISEKTLGSLIRDARLKSKVSINELSSRTKIHKTLLLHLENDRYEKLPKKIYVAGFLKLLSTLLNFDLKEAQNLLAISEEKQNVSVRTWNKAKILTYSLPLFYKKTTKFNNKILLSCVSGLVASGFFVFMLMGQGLRRNEVVVKKAVSIKPPTVATKELTVFMNPISIIIEAIHGDSWIAYKVNDDKVVTFTLEKGKNLHLKANSIRLVLGNYNALKITKDSKEFVYKGKLIKNVANIIFPEKLKEQNESPYIYFNKDGSTASNERFNNTVEI